MDYVLKALAVITCFAACGGDRIAERSDPTETVLPDPTGGPIRPRRSEAWLFDTSRWAALPDGRVDEGCIVSEAIPDGIVFPCLAWEKNCGDGCEVADVVQGYGEVTRGGGLVTVGEPGRPQAFLRVYHPSIPLKGGHPGDVALTRIVDLDSGATVAATKIDRSVDSECVGDAFWGDGLMSSGYWVKEGVGRINGAWSPASGQWNWLRPWSFDSYPITCEGVIRLTDGSAGVLRMCKGEVLGRFPGSTELSVVDRPGEAGFRAIGEGKSLGKIAIWPEYETSGQSRIREWSAESRSTRTVVDGIKGYVRAVTVGDSRIAGLSGELNAPNFTNEMKFWFGPRSPKALDARELSVGPVISSNFYRPYFVTTWGGFISAVMSKSESDRYGARAKLAVVRTADWKVRWFGTIEGPDQVGREAEVATVTDRYLYVMRRPTLGSRSKESTEVFRYDLSRFDEIGSATDDETD